MFGRINVTIDANGVPYLRTNSVTVGTDAVDFSLGFRRIPAVTHLSINIANSIPEGTTGTLPVRFTLNGQTRTLTFFGGSSVTAADLVGTGVIDVLYDWYNGFLQLVSPLAPATA